MIVVDYDYIADMCSYFRSDLFKYVGLAQDIEWLETKIPQWRTPTYNKEEVLSALEEYFKLKNATCGDGRSLKAAIEANPILNPLRFLSGMSANYVSGRWSGIAGVHTKYSSNSDNWTDELMSRPKSFQAKMPFTLN